jgi:prepilin-type N-terminal cleavage/methylation domain-containing protein
MYMLQTEAQRRKSSEGGFTLVELLVVIVIIGILAAVAVFAVAGIADKGQTASCSADRRAVQTAVEAYRAQQANPSAAASIPTEAQLVPNFLAELSTLHNVSATGAVTPVSPCT